MVAISTILQGASNTAERGMRALMHTLDPDALECLAAILEEGGFERAARKLGITQSAVSQRLRSLETQLGAELVVRSRPLKATEIGKLLLRHTLLQRSLRADLERELKALRDHAGSGPARGH